METFNGYNWEYNGPLLLTRVLKKFCNTQKLSNTYKCKEFDIFPQHACYAVEWREWQKFFNKNNADEVMKLIQDSYFVHLWNAKSKGTKVERTSPSAYALLAAKHCPRVHQHNLMI